MLFFLSYVYFLLDVILCMGGEASKGRPFPKNMSEAKGRYKQGTREWLTPPSLTEERPQQVIHKTTYLTTTVQGCRCSRDCDCKCLGDCNPSGN